MRTANRNAAVPGACTRNACVKKTKNLQRVIHDDAKLVTVVTLFFSSFFAAFLSQAEAMEGRQFQGLRSAHVGSLLFQHLRHCRRSIVALVNEIRLVEQASFVEEFAQAALDHLLHDLLRLPFGPCNLREEIPLVLEVLWRHVLV
mmetsp:Transcript_26718/g.49934  ORF Transcript_26718/g.49934 Transcript_26718/m.49934 type:complete len:145 (-) Transcript_26718:223-657(-)